MDESMIPNAGPADRGPDPDPGRGAAPPPPPPILPRQRRRWRTALLLVVALVSATALIAPSLAASYARSYLGQSVRERCDGTLEMDDLALSWGGSYEVTNLRLRTRDGQPLLTLPRVRGTIAWGKALAGRLDIVARLERPELVIRKQADGRTNLAAFMGSQPPSDFDFRTLPLALDLQIDGGTAALGDGPRMTRIKDLAFRAVLPSLTDPVPIAAGLDIDGGGRLKVEGTAAALGREGKLTYTLTAGSLGAFSGAASLFADIDRLEGKLAAHGTYTWKWPQVEGNDEWQIEAFHGSGRAFGSEPLVLDRLVGTTHTSSDGAGRGICSLQVAAGRTFQTAASFRLADLATERRSVEGTVNVTGDLAEAAARLALPPDTKYGGSFALALAVTGTGDRYRVNQDLTLHDFTVNGDVVDPAATLVSTLEVDRGRHQLDITSSQVRSRFLNGTAVGRLLDWGHAARLSDLRIDCRYVPERLSRVLAPWLHGTLEGAVEQPLRATLDGPVGQLDPWSLVRGASGRVALGLDKYTCDGIYTTSTVNAVLADGHMKIDGPLSINRGTVDVKADLDLRPAARGPRSTFAIASRNAAANPAMTSTLGRLHPLFAGLQALDGILQLDLRGSWEGPLDTAPAREALRMKGSLRVSSLSLSGSPFVALLSGQLGLPDPGRRADGELVVDNLEVAGGVISYPNCVLRLGGNTLDFGGTVDFEGNLHLTMELPLPEGLAKKNPALGTLVGERIAVPLGGTLSAPKLEMGRLLEDLVKRAAQKRLQEQTEGLIPAKVKELTPFGKDRK